MSEEKVSFQVNFKGKSIQIKDFPVDKSISELKEHLEESTNIPKEYQKLIFKAILKDTSTLRESNIKNDIKVMLIGSSQQEIQNLKESESKLVKRHESKYAINPYKNLRKVQDLESQKYTIHQIKVIENIPNSGKAREILERLRDDRGIKAIMKKHKFSIGLLQEMDLITMFRPSNENKKLLGYNVNKGEEVSLRLRTDDLQGFRYYTDIKKVLLHELTHNVWPDHDENFHRLHRQLNKDVVSLDWTLSVGNKLSDEEFYNPPEQEVGGRSWQGGSYVLGGDSERVKILPRRELLAEAALMRLTKEEEKELDEGCGSKPNPPS